MSARPDTFSTPPTADMATTAVKPPRRVPLTLIVGGALTLIGVAIIIVRRPDTAEQAVR